jgi:hypothetical protein
MASTFEREDHPRLQGWEDPVETTGDLDSTVLNPPPADLEAAKKDPTLPLPRHLHDLWVVLGLDE